MLVIKTDISKDRDWNDFLRNEYNMFYDYKFLSYNDAFGKNIKWHHLKFISREKHKTVAVLNGCEDTDKGIRSFISCKGVSFGGFIWNEKMKLPDYIKAINFLKKYLKENDFNRCVIINPPSIYHKNSYEEYEYALIYEGFKTTNISITNIIDLNSFEFEKLANPKKRSIKKSETHIRVEFMSGEIDREYFNKYYDVLLKNRKLKNVKPTHTIDELLYLKNSLSDKIQLFSAYIDKTLAGICVLFLIRDDIVLNFYLASDEIFKKERVPDFILYRSIEWAKKYGFRLYDIGTSNIGNQLLEGLFDFKKKFMANGYLRKTFVIDL